MLHGSLAFLGGIVYLSGLDRLPDPLWCQFLPLLLVSARYHRASRLLSVFLAGLLWASLQAQLHLQRVLEPRFEGQDLELAGRVEGIPRPFAEGTRFRLRVDEPPPGAASGRFPALLRLNWYRAEDAPLPGQRLRLRVRLNRPSGVLNRYGRDHEAWLFSEGIHATGYVRAPLWIEPPTGRQRFVLDRWRLRLGADIARVVDEGPGRRLLPALALGLRDGIGPRQWDVLRATGTAHLVAISGLHIGLVAGFVFLLVRRLWSHSPSACHLLAASRAAALPAMTAALLYAAMAGFALPTQRALLMLGGLLLAQLLGGAIASWRILALSLVLLLVADPWSVLSASFWLSFGAVALIGYAMTGRIGVSRSRWWRWGRVHLVLAVGLAPLLMAMPGGAPLVAPLANLVAVPWVTLLVVPLTLCGSVALPVLPWLGAALLRLAADGLDLLWPFLTLLQGLEPGLAVVTLDPVWLVPAACWLLAPKGWPARWLGLVPVLVLLQYRPPSPSAGHAWFSLLDVGQGLAAVVRTRRHVLVFDTGAGLPGGYNLAEAVVLPNLAAQGVARIDRLVISHSDNDHAGGLARLLETMPVSRLLAGGDLQSPGAEPCVAGTGWTWDGVAFRVLNPVVGDTGSENNRSCVLLVDAGGTRLLLSADIEAESEHRLVARFGDALRADVLVAPHHGSRSSSTAAFVRAVAPDYVLFPVGYRNRWSFPNPLIVQRYRAQGSVALDTARHGGIELHLGSPAGVSVVSVARQTRRRFWQRSD